MIYCRQYDFLNHSFSLDIQPHSAFRYLGIIPPKGEWTLCICLCLKKGIPVECHFTDSQIWLFFFIKIRGSLFIYFFWKNSLSPWPDPQPPQLPLAPPPLPPFACTCMMQHHFGAEFYKEEGYSIHSGDRGKRTNMFLWFLLFFIFSLRLVKIACVKESEGWI